MVACLRCTRSSLFQILDNVFDDVLSGSFFRSIKPLKKRLGPDDAVNDLLWLLPNSTHREGLVLLSIDALVARRDPLHDADTGHVIPVGTGVNQRLAKVEAHLVDVFSCFLVV